MDACDWIKIDDPSTNRSFYANKKTNQRTWTMPEEYRVAHGLTDTSESQWWELVDATTGNVYYHNVETGETVWEKPEDVTVMKQDHHKGKAPEKKEKKKKTKRSKGKRSNNKKKPPPPPPDTPESAAAGLLDGWVAHFDQEQQQFYYHHAASKETTWDRSRAVAPVTPRSAVIDDESDESESDDEPDVPPPVAPLPTAALAPPVDAPPAITLPPPALASAPPPVGAVPSPAPAAAAVSPGQRRGLDRTETPLTLRKNNRRGGTLSRKTVDEVIDVLEEGETGEDGVERAYTRQSSVPSRDVVRSALPEGRRETALPTSIAEEITHFQLEGFARKFFDSHKKGVFRRQIPIKRMLKWSKDPIPSSMIKMSKPAVSKEAVNVNKHILKYMGDLAPTKNKLVRPPMWNAMQIVQAAIQTPELRDEIYCQLCRQTNSNPNPQSLAKGWELFVMCAYSFPPTKDFEDWLLQYIAAHRDEEIQGENRGTTALFAAYTLRLLTRTIRLFSTMRGKAPSEKELQVQREAPFNPSPFGASLAECMDLQAATFPDEPLPVIMTILADAVLANGGPTTEGIFRVPADTTISAKVKVALEQGGYQVNQKDAHAIGSVLKLWFRELSEPLIPDELYEDAIAAATANDDEACLDVTHQMPELNRVCLLYLITFLRKMAGFHEQTKMTDANLSMVFAPNVLRCPSQNPQIIYNNSKHEVSFMTALMRMMKE